MPRSTALAWLLAWTLAWTLGGAHAAELQVRVTGPAGTPEANVVVFVPAAGAAAPPAARRASIHQSRRVFDPYVTVVTRGTAIDFPNDDTIFHHVYSFSPAKRFEIKLYRGMPPAPVVFDTPGIVALGCNMHDWMLGYVVVLDTPHHALTGPQGTARIADLPAGRHAVMVWYPGAREPRRAQTVELAESGSRSIELRLDAAPRQRPAPPPHDPIRY